jgi:hypothetical protein
MSRVIAWNSSGSREVTSIARPRWREVRQGLVLALVGYFLLLGPGLLGLLLLVAENNPAADWLRLNDEDAEALAQALAGLGGFGGYALVLVGQWRCLLYAPQGHGAKDVQFACLLCTLLVPPIFVAAHFLGGKATFLALGRGPDGVLDLDLMNGGLILQVAGLLVGLTSVLLFSAFARSLARCMRNDGGARRVNLYFWFVAFLAGGTVGGFLQVRYFRREVLPVLALGWLVCLLWHAWVIRGASRGIGRVLRQQRSGMLAAARPAAAAEKGQLTLRAASYLHRRE